MLKLLPLLETVAKPAAEMVVTGTLMLKLLVPLELIPDAVPVCVKATFVGGTVIKKLLPTLEGPILMAPVPLRVVVAGGILMLTEFVPEPEIPETPAVLLVVICINGTFTTKEFVAGLLTDAFPVPVSVGDAELKV